VHFFDRAYEGIPLWDIGRPQAEIVRLEESGEIQGRVLDVGCGTGENAVYLSGCGHETWGIDFAERAIERARSKALARNLPTRFETANALELAALGQTFDTVVDCGLFHTFLDEHRPVYAAGIRGALRPGGRFFLFCFSEKEPPDWGGPRRITQAEIRATFGGLLKERWIRSARFETTLPSVRGEAWLASYAARPGGTYPPEARTSRSSVPARRRRP
jgi:SAM-dependent methyltransferase